MTKQIKKPIILDDVQPKYKNSDNSYLFTTTAEPVDPLSQTIPDQSMPIAMLIQRYASGLPMSGVKVPLYSDEDSLLAGINLDKLDLAEREELFKGLRDKYEESLSRVRAREKETAIKQQQQRIDEQVQLQLEKLKVKPDDIRDTK